MRLSGLFFFLSVLFITETVSAQNIRINEFMALNQSILIDDDGDYSDWIELYNFGGTDINLQGWSLTDQQNIPFKWLFPDVTLHSGEYLLVFASSKDRNTPGQPLHTNFNLSGSGEYLGLINPSGIAVSEFAPAFQPQTANISLGYTVNGYTGFVDPTPGRDNGLSTGTVVPAPVFSKSRGLYESAFTLQLSSTVSNSKIYYTTNGSTPSATNGSIYSTAINITTTSVVRAIAIVNGSTPSKVITNTYLFLNDVLRQPNNPAGYPSAWGPYTGITGTAIADYEMDQELLKDATYAATVKKSFTELPIVSLVTDIPNLFSSSTDPLTGGIYIYTGAPIGTTTYATGRDWERPVSFEFFDLNGKNFGVNCGIQIQGGHGRRPEKSPKHSFLIDFDSDYGPSKLDYPLMGENSASKFNKLILRAGFGNTWIHQETAQRTKATYQEDIWTKDTQRAMGHPSSNSIYVHLFINGIYWGMYAPSERMDKDFAENYMGGNAEDFDVIKDYAEVSDGNITAWNKMMSMANAGLTSNDSYQLIQGKNPDGSINYNTESMVDVENLADYMLINFWGGNTDWDHHNWSAMRNRVNPGKGFRFLCWDGELMFSSTTANILNENNPDCPSNVYQQLLLNSSFKHLLADRIQRHCFNDGVLTPDSAKTRWLKRKAQIEDPIMAEAARWGDYRRDVHQWTSSPYNLYTKDGYWTPQQNFTLNTFFPQRTGIFVGHLRSAGLFPSIDAPVFKINDKVAYQKNVLSGDKLTMTAAKGTIYYTADGSDPVDWTTGKPTAKALLYAQAITLQQSGHYVTRALYNGEWSAANSRYYQIPADLKSVKITEIHYHPLAETGVDNGEFEFVELKNTGTATLDLGGTKFTKGVGYQFAAETEMRPGNFIVLASNSNAFFSRYRFRPMDEYDGRLDNNGEEIVWLSSTGDTIAHITYQPGGDWPDAGNGQGYSLVPTTYNPTGNQNLASNWRLSYRAGGSPGADDSPLSAIQVLDGSALGKSYLAQNYPNPFSDFTHIDYSIPADAQVELAVYDLTGAQIVQLTNAFQSAGKYEKSWNGCSATGERVTAGLYFYRLTVHTATETQIQTKKMLLYR